MAWPIGSLLIVSFKKNFCASPWFHTRINNSGHYEYCRWAVKHSRQTEPSIRDQTPVQWFQQGMSNIRQSLLEGQSLPGCAECRVMEQHGKVSGRQKQLLKAGVTVQDFQKTMLSSPWSSAWQHSLNHNGNTDQLPKDWQIDLGNYCNSACVFCDPYSSSKLASEFKKIGFIKELPPRAWVDDPDQLKSFLNTLEVTPDISYLHFIGGETLITPAFRTILEKLIDTGLSNKITIGFTTNLTVWNDEIATMLTKFHQVNLGLSVECFHPLNDYVRYGSQIDVVEKLTRRWIDLGKSHGWLIQLRVTPTLFSIWHLDTVYQFARDNHIAVESCNFLAEPAFMRPSVLPREWRDQVQKKLETWIASYDLELDTAPVINTRHPLITDRQVIEDATSYVNYLKDRPDESDLLPDLVYFIRTIEHNRGNRVLDYLPEYEQFLRSAGY
jgi:sulfatase maturation enzyme AslB (radical SAM superfamily)